MILIYNIYRYVLLLEYVEQHIFFAMRQSKIPFRMFFSILFSRGFNRLYLPMPLRASQAIYEAFTAQFPDLDGGEDPLISLARTFLLLNGGAEGQEIVRS